LRRAGENNPKRRRIPGAARARLLRVGVGVWVRVRARVRVRATDRV
jgi:hypothetical protein